MQNAHKFNEHNGCAGCASFSTPGSSGGCRLAAARTGVSDCAGFAPTNPNRVWHSPRSTAAEVSLASDKRVWTETPYFRRRSQNVRLL